MMQETAPVSRDASRPPLGLGKKMIFSVAATAAVFLVAEVGLAIFWDPPPPSDPYVGFSNTVPLLVSEQAGFQSGGAGEKVVSINPAKLVWFNKQSFPEAKSADTFRIVCLGGSTTFGRPFDDSTSFCGWLRTLLPMVDPKRDWEVINAGGISYASYRIASVMEEFSQHDVDLFVLYTGQNEFLEWRTYGDLADSSETPRVMASLAAKTRLGKSIQTLVNRYRNSDSENSKSILPAEVDEILNHSVGPAHYGRDPDWYRGVEEHFRVNLKRMRRIAEDAGSRLAVVTPVSNLRDCSPFKGEFGDSIDDVTRAQLLDRLEQAEQAFAENDVDRCHERLESILVQDRENAKVDFLMGRALLALGRGDEAAEWFQLAIDHDICPLRATTKIKEIIREFLAEDDVIAIDFESNLAESVRSKIGHVCFGAESFLDHVHPTIDVHREITLAILQSLVDQGVLSRPPSAEQVDRATAEIEGSIGLQAQGVAFRNLAKVTHWAGKFEEAERNARDALRLLPYDLESRLVLADCLEKAGQPEAAMQQYRRLFADGNLDRACQPFGELLAAQGYPDAAKAYLMQAVFVSQGRRQASAYESLGRLHESLGEMELSRECFENAKKLQ
jgi:tetratricopeptide (TPR) repeat protein